MPRQRIDCFEYGGTYKVQPLYLKSRHLHKESEGYGEQETFDEALVATGLFEFGEFGPDKEHFDEVLQDSGYRIDGVRLVQK
jgi:hypothetical protein